MIVPFEIRLLGTWTTQLAGQQPSARDAQCSKPEDAELIKDAMQRHKAAEEITKALKFDGIYALFFVVTLEAGRIKPADKATMKVVLEACPEITKYSIIVNKVTKKEMKRFDNPADAEQLRAGFTLLADDSNTPLRPMPEAENMYYYKQVPEYDDHDEEQDGPLVPEHDQKFVQFVEAAPAFKVHNEKVTPVNVESYKEVVQKVAKENAMIKQEIAQVKAKQTEEAERKKKQDAERDEKARNEAKEQRIEAERQKQAAVKEAVAREREEVNKEKKKRKGKRNKRNRKEKKKRNGKEKKKRKRDPSSPRSSSSSSSSNSSSNSSSSSSSA